jgi:alkanesulfonate monooxygenase SsuD/methylene tetrahydromethanopterin reductase-like flavin-dependent oxidoreductase (luciferase family)
VPVYAAFHEWLGRGPQLEPVWAAWKAGDRAAALAAIPDEVVDDLIIHGSYDECRAHIQRYVDNGVTTLSITVMPLGGVDVREAVRRLAPSA